MATTVNLGGDGTLFRGEDKTLTLEILTTGLTPIDAAGWAVHWVVRRATGDSASVLDKTATITGVYSATRATNTQRASVTVGSSETILLTDQLYAHTWKRTDTASKSVLCRGQLTVEHSAADAE